METLSRTGPHHHIMVLPKSLPQGLAGRDVGALRTSPWGHQEGWGPQVGKSWSLERYECAGVKGKNIPISSPWLRH